MAFLNYSSEALEFIVTLILVALGVIVIGAWAALTLRLRMELRAASEEIEVLRARLAAPTVWSSLGAHTSDLHGLQEEMVSRPLGAQAFATQDFSSQDFQAPQAWLLDPPEPGSATPGKVDAALPAPMRGRGRKAGVAVARSLSPETLNPTLFGAWSAEASLLPSRPETPALSAVPRLAWSGPWMRAALLGAYAAATLAGLVLQWPWAILLPVLVVLAAVTATAFPQVQRLSGVAAGLLMGTGAFWTATAAGAPALLTVPSAGALIAAGLVFVARQRAGVLSWTPIAALCLSVGAALALMRAQVWVVPPAALVACSVALLGVLGLAVAAFGGVPAARRPASALHAASVALLALTTVSFGPVTAYGYGLASLVLLTAVFARGKARDTGLVAAWLAACAGLYSLSGDAAAPLFLTPAAILTGALFFAAGAARAGASKTRGLVLHALTAAGPLAALLALRPMPWEAAAFAVVAVLLGLVFAAAMQAQGAHETAAPTALGEEARSMGSFRLWPLTLGAVCAATLSLEALAPAPLLAAVCALACVFAALMAARTGMSALAVAALALAGLSSSYAIEASVLAPLRAASWIGAATAGAALIAGGWLVSARGVGRAPMTSFALGLAGVAVWAVAPAAALPDTLHRLSGIGAIGCVWLSLGLTLQLFGAPQGPARTTGLGFVVAGAATVLCGLVITANPWWSAQAAPFPVEGPAPSLVLGVGLPAVLLAAGALLAQGRGQRWRAAVFWALAALTLAVGAALLLRVLAAGAQLRDAGFSALELLGFTALIAVVGALCLARSLRGPRDTVLQRLGLILLATAATKLLLMDLHVAGLLPAMVCATLAVMALGLAIAGRHRLLALWRA
jgi:hypothetical protein